MSRVAYIRHLFLNTLIHHILRHVTRAPLPHNLSDLGWTPCWELAWNLKQSNLMHQGRNYIAENATPSSFTLIYHTKNVMILRSSLNVLYLYSPATVSNFRDPPLWTSVICVILRPVSTQKSNHLISVFFFCNGNKKSDKSNRNLLNPSKLQWLSSKHEQF